MGTIRTLFFDLFSIYLQKIESVSVMARIKELSGLMIAIAWLLSVGCTEPTSPSPPADIPTMTPSEIFTEVAAKYKSMKTYEAEGTITSDIDTGESTLSTETAFSILLKKPNLYRIAWTQKGMPMAGMEQTGAVWSDGTQPYLYMGIMNAYSKMGDDQTALGGATGISGGAAFTIPSLFLPVFEQQPDPFSRLIDPKVQESEKVGDDDCYVISGSSPISKQETYWVSKTSHLIRKYYRSLEAPEGGMPMPEMTDEDIEEALKSMGQEVTDESRQKMKEMMEQSKDVVRAAMLKGSSTELHVEISSPAATANDFQFAPPKGSVLKDSLFGNVLGDQE